MKHTKARHSRLSCLALLSFAVAALTSPGHAAMGREDSLGRGEPPAPIAKLVILGVSPRDVEADDMDEFDEVATGLSAVGVGTKVYLQGEELEEMTVSAYNWALVLQPPNSTAMLSASSGELVTFRPDVRGDYVVELTPLDLTPAATTPVLRTIRAGTYIGVGVFDTSAPPDPTIPECGNVCCHGDSNQPRLNVLDQWFGSRHASKLMRDLGGQTVGHYSVSCLNCHSLGFNQSPEAMNNGFDDIAADLGYDLEMIPALVEEAFNMGIDNWPQLPPELQGHSNIQCESCHGPGSQHLGNLVEDDAGIGGVNLNTEQCAQCHDSASGFQQGFYQWNLSAHPLTASLAEGHVAETASCVKCHTGEGYVAVYVNGMAPAPVPDANGITCSACHDPHNSDNDHQLRLVGDFTFDSGQTFVDAGIGGLCMRCHSARVSDPETTALNSSRGAHHGPQGDMLLGINLASFGLPFAVSSAHTTIVDDTCVTCHMAAAPVSGPGITEQPAVGEHTYSMRDDNGTPGDPSDDILNVDNTCALCHPAIGDDYDLTARGDYDGDGTVEGVQTEMDGLFNLLRPQILATMVGTSVDPEGHISIGSGDFGNLTDNQKRALYNYRFLWEDGSKGIHNTSIAVQALQRSYFGVFGRSILDDFPNIDLRGPVQPPTVPPPPPTPSATPIPTPEATPATNARIVVRAVSPRVIGENMRGVTLDEVGTGLRTVGVGNKVYLDAEVLDGDVTAFAWSVVTRPMGSTAALSDPAAESTTFRPDRNGRYVLRLTTTATPQLAAHDLTLYAGQWVGVGILNTHEEPDPHAPECATGFCHGGDNAEPTLAVAPEWINSDHAQKLQHHLGGERGPDYDVSCLQCHTLGFNEAVTADNGGFDDIAVDISYDLAQIPALVADAVMNGVDNWPLLPAELQGHASVQCEACHGAGSQHLVNLLASDKGIDGVNLDAKQCAQCHDSPRPGEMKFYQWSESSHPVTAELSEGHVAETASCVKCHTGQGFVDVQVHHNAGQPQPEAVGITCAACHDPHFSENPASLRLVGDFKFDSGDMSIVAGKGGLCMRCHNSRVSNVDTTSLSSFRGAHHGPQGDMLMGINGASFSLAFAQNSPHSVVVPDTCTTCHMAETPEGEPLVGSHTYSLRDDRGTPDPGDDFTNHVNACSRCHIDIASLDFPSMGDYDGDGIVEGTQTEVAGLFDLLRPEILATFAGTSESELGNISIGSGDFASLTDDQKRALYNFNFVWDDGSLGVHNTSYAVQLLQRSYFGVFGRPIDEDYPDIDLRGPVQGIAPAIPASVVLR